MEGGKESTKVVDTEKWTYPRFREYMVSLTGGPDFLLPFDRYPKRIELSDPWHELLDKMRQESKDGKERFALIGFKDDKRSLYLPTSLTKGSSHDVSSEAQVQALEYAKAKAGIIGLVGDIHSHPNGWLEKLYHLQNFAYLPFKGSLHGFSPDDFTMLTELNFMGLSDGNSNFFAFKSRETHADPANVIESNYDKFREYWLNKMGAKEIKNFPVLIPINPLRQLVSPWSINKMIARRYKIGLYKGSPGEDLVRVIPKEQNPSSQ